MILSLMYFLTSLKTQITKYNVSIQPFMSGSSILVLDCIYVKNIKH